MKKTGLTLIELLIVITIIAIIAGAVLPYVQRYVEDARASKAKQDLGEIRGALIRYENDQKTLYADASINKLVGSYLNKSFVDPWGSQYVVFSDHSKCYSVGPDRIDNSGDEISQYFRPPLAISRVFWIDTNKNMKVDDTDALQIKFTRPLRAGATDGPSESFADDDFVYSSASTVSADYSREFSSDKMSVIMTFGNGANPSFTPNKDSLSVKNTNKIFDGEGIPCLPDQPILIKSY